MLPCMSAMSGPRDVEMTHENSGVFYIGSDNLMFEAKERIWLP